MNDISKCSNESCPRKSECKRYTMHAWFMQSYAEFPWWEDCEYFI